MRAATVFLWSVTLGFAGLAAACGDPTPPAPKGSVEIHVAQFGACSSDVLRAPSGIGHPSDNMVLTDGAGGKVSCSVSSSSPHAITVSLSYDDTDNPFGFSLIASLPDTAKGATNAVTADDVSLHYRLASYSSSSCKVWLGDPNDKTAANSPHIVNGGVWGQFSCDMIDAQSQGNSTCSISESTFLFEDCSTN